VKTLGISDIMVVRKTTKKSLNKEVSPMAIIPQMRLFDYREVESLGDLERLRLVIEYIPDEEFMKHLEKERGNGRNKYPIRGMWNSILAGIVYEHSTIESLRRELSRNGQLRAICGLGNKVPPAWVYSRFIDKLLEEEHKEYIEEIFNKLIELIRELLPDFGETLAIDGKAIESFANSHKYDYEEKLKEDRRRDLDADYGKKVYYYEDEEGNKYKKIKRWFGYKLHLIVDAAYELPVAFKVTPASGAEAPVAHKLIDELDENHPELKEKCKYFLGNRGYDDGKLIKKCWDDHQIKPIIDIRNMWKDGEETKLLKGKDNIVYDYCGNVYCYDPVTGRKREMAYGGFEKDRNAIKERCPAEHYGIECKGKDKCSVSGSFRISLEEDRRVFTPVARQSYKWNKIYKARTSVERVNSRLDVSYGFENHTIRRIKKMRLKCSISMIVMLAMAVGRIKEKQEEKMRSLVKPA
jgi:transposase